MKDKTIYQRVAIYLELNEYCIHAKENDFMEICEWWNGDGFDVSINDKVYAFTYGQFKALKKGLKELDKKFNVT